jgi:hypothetical protein
MTAVLRRLGQIGAEREESAPSLPGLACRVSSSP